MIFLSKGLVFKNIIIILMKFGDRRLHKKSASEFNFDECFLRRGDIYFGKYRRETWHLRLHDKVMNIVQYFYQIISFLKTTPACSATYQAIRCHNPRNHNVDEEYCLLGYNIVWSVVIQPTFRRHISAPYSGSKNSRARNQLESNGLHCVLAILLTYRGGP
jgi:hypothetical protein